MQQRPNILAAAQQATAHISNAEITEIFSDTVVLLSAPRSGSTLLFEQMSARGPYWTVGGESHAIFRAFPHLRAEDAALTSMALDERHADEGTCRMMRRCFLMFLRDSSGVPWLSLPLASRPKKICFLEKTPRNALNIPFLLKVFPSARFLFLRRDAKQTVSSLIEAWGIGLQSGRFVTFRDLPQWHLPAWCFLLPRGWQGLRGKSIAEIAAFQWCSSNDAIVDALTTLETSLVKLADYSSLIQDPGAVLADISSSLGLEEQLGQSLKGDLALSRTTVSKPRADKWRRHQAEIEPLLPMLSRTQDAIDVFCDTVLKAQG